MNLIDFNFIKKLVNQSEILILTLIFINLKTEDRRDQYNLL